MLWIVCTVLPILSPELLPRQFLGKSKSDMYKTDSEEEKNSYKNKQQAFAIMGMFTEKGRKDGENST